MSKKVKAIINIIKKDQRGFSMIELLTAIAILAVLAGSVIFIMNSSSQTYNKLSVEAQLQSEAQLVANMITELAIDSINAYSVMDDKKIGDTTFNMNYDEAANKILILESTLDNKTTQYVIAKKNGKNELYLAERLYNNSSKTWGTLSEALLGDYITGFTVDTSRVEAENMLSFTLSYEKNGRTYDGNYQVLMRNRAYADTVSSNNPSESGTLLSVDLSPKVVYVDVVDDEVTQYYKEEVTDSNKVTNVANGIEFTATVNTNATADKNKVDWSLERHDDGVFEVANATSLTNYVNWNNKTKMFKNSPTDSFMVKATKTVTLSDGKTLLSRSKSSMILLRRIKGLSLYAMSGATQWRKEFEEYEVPGVPSPIAQGYAYLANNGQYMPMTIGASLVSSNIPYGGGLRWYVYKQNSAGGWDKIAGYGETDNAALVTLQDKETLTTTSNVVNFGAAVTNGQVFKVEAVSMFDPSWKAEYIFGIAPKGDGEGDGFYSRGYYMDMEALFLQDKSYFHDSMSEFSKLCFLRVTSVDAAGQNGLSGDKVKVIRDANGKWRLYIDFDAFAYSGEQKESFYTGDVCVHLTIGYYDSEGRLCIDGSGSSQYKKELEQQEGRKVSPNYEANHKTYYCQMSNDIKYYPKKVKVTKVSPTNNLIVIAKGKTRSVTAQTSYYNILSPRNGMQYLGVYLDDTHNNLIESGKGTTHAYFDVSMTSSYGDTNRYVDRAAIQLVAKPNQRKYLTKPSFLRIAANDFYLIKATPHNDSYTEYNVLIANIEGTETYIAGPEATGRLTWSAEQATSITNGTKTEIKGQDSGGNEVTAKVYKSGNKYYCEYNGTTYKYNTAYDFWAK